MHLLISKVKIDIFKGKIEKTNAYNAEHKRNINKKLEHKNNGERDENETLYERIVLLEKENNCLKNEIKNQQLVIQMLSSNENGKTQQKSSKSINPDFVDKPETNTPINLTNRFESCHIAEENSGPVGENNDVTTKYTISNGKPKSRHSLLHTLEQGHWTIIRQRLIQQDITMTLNEVHQLL